MKLNPLTGQLETGLSAGQVQAMINAALEAIGADGEGRLPATGDLKLRFVSGGGSLNQGWVRCEGGTISKGNPGGDFFGDEYQPLYEHLWNSAADAQCPVIGGRGTDATSDWNANKPMTLPDFRARAAVGLDPGNATGRLSSGELDGTLLGYSGGADTHTLIEAQMPAHVHGYTEPQGPSYSFTAGGADQGVSGTQSNYSQFAGGGQSHNNVQPSIVAGVWFIKL